jgi:hypothetical protein
MFRPTRGVASLARVALAGVFVAACAQAPGQSVVPTPSGSAPPAGTAGVAAPGSSAVSATRSPSPVGLRWERLNELVDVAYVHDLVRGGDGWVGVGDGCRAGCEPANWTSWFSGDGRSWTATPLPMARDSGAEQLAWGGAGYVAMGMDRRPVGNEMFTKVDVWRSDDGQAWDRTAADLELDACRGAECQHVRGIALAPSGAIVVGYAYFEDQPSAGPYVSDDGHSWALVEPAAFGVDALEVRDVESTAGEVFLFGRTCRSCPTKIWTSTEGRTWTSAGELAAMNVGSAGIATDGRRRIAALVTCSGTTDCVSEVWSSVDGGPWTRDLVRPDLQMLEVVNAGDAFVLVGLRSETYEALVSVDGSDWVTVEPGPPSDDDCGVAWLAGGPGTVILGDPDCGIWRGTLIT